MAALALLQQLLVLLHALFEVRDLSGQYLHSLSHEPRKDGLGLVADVLGLGGVAVIRLRSTGNRKNHPGGFRVGKLTEAI